MRSRIKVRLGSPVNGSWVARNASCSSAPWRSDSKASHIRTSVTLRLRCNMLTACASTSGERASCAAISPTTSSAASHQRRQRLVTSFNGAARWAASCPKICQDSWPTSRATSAPSPAIQRATATVETAPTRSKLSSTIGSRTQLDSLVRETIPATTSSVRAFSASPRRRRSSSSSSGCASRALRAREDARARVLDAASTCVVGCREAAILHSSATSADL